MTSDPDQLIPRAVRETLDAVVSPAVRETMLTEALALQGTGEIPTDPDQFREFLAGPLKAALVRALGTELGETVAGELQQVAEYTGPPSSSQPEPAPESSSAARSARMERQVSTEPRRKSSPPPRPPSPVPPRRRHSPRPATLHAAPLGTLTPPPQPAFSATLTAAETDERPTQPPPMGHPAREEMEVRPPVSSSGPPASSGFKSTLPGQGPPSSISAPPGVITRPPSSAAYPRGAAATLGVRGAPGGRLPYLLVASRDPDLVKRLSAWVDPRVAVVRARSLIDLLHDLEDTRGSNRVILLDCTQPSMRPVALAAVADDLPDQIQVVLWKADARLRDRLIGVSSRAADWISLRPDEELRDVAVRCAELTRKS